MFKIFPYHSLSLNSPCLCPSVFGGREKYWVGNIINLLYCIIYLCDECWWRGNRSHLHFCGKEKKMHFFTFISILLLLSRCTGYTSCTKTGDVTATCDCSECGNVYVKDEVGLAHIAVTYIMPTTEHLS